MIAIIAILASLILPVTSRAKENGRGAACLSNLHQIGIAMQLYVEDNENKFPFMRDRLPGGTNAPAPPSPDVVLTNYLGNKNILRCPSDMKQIFEQTGSSYSWNSLLNGQKADHLEILNISFDSHLVPLFFDKEDFHAARGPTKSVNFLYADGHIKNLLEIEGTK